MTTDQWLHVLGLFVLFIFSAFFSSSETALMSMDRLRVKYLAEKERPGAKRLEALLSKPDDLLSAILVGNNLVNIMISVFATALFLDLFGQGGEFCSVHCSSYGPGSIRWTGFSAAMVCRGQRSRFRSYPGSLPMNPGWLPA